MDTSLEILSTSRLGGAHEVEPASLSGHYPPCLLRLRGLLATLSAAECRAADWLLAHPEETLRLPVNEVAAQAAVGVGTIARLCSRLGYKGFPELRIALAIEMLNPDLREPDQIVDSDDTSAVIRKVVRFGERILSDTAALLDPRALARAAAATARAQHVFFFAGGGYTTPIATLAANRFLVLEVLTAAYVGEWDRAAVARLLGEGDVAVGLSYTGEADDVNQALLAAAGRGATTIGITNTPASRIVASSQISLIAGSPEGWSWGHPASSRIGMLAVIDALYAAALLIRSRDRVAKGGIPDESAGDRDSGGERR